MAKREIFLCVFPVVFCFTVVFSCTSCLLCSEQTRIVMKSQFETIVTYLLEADRAVLKTLTFDSLCRCFGASPRLMNSCFYDSFGMSGDEVIQNVGLFY